MASSLLKLTNRVYEHLREQSIQRLWRPLPPAPLGWPLDTHLLRECELHWPSGLAWPDGEKWLSQLRRGFRTHLKVVSSNHLPRAGSPHVVYLELYRSAKKYLLAVDYADDSGIDEEAATRVTCYFKMQHRAEGYNQASILPGGYVANHEAVYRYAPRLRTWAGRSAKYDLYGRFSLSFSPQVRTRALSVLRNQGKFHFHGGPHPVRYARFLEEAAQSRLCLDLPGQGNLCFRLVDYLALGCAVVRPPPMNVLHVPLNEGEHYLVCRSDFSDLVDVCVAVLEKPELLKALQQRAAEYFDRYLHCDQLAAYYLSQCFKRFF